MDYGAYKKIELRRRFWKFLGVDISIFDPASNQLIGFINQRTIMIKPDVFVYTDKTMQTAVVNLKKQTVLKSTPVYSIIDPANQSELGTLQFNAFRSYLVRWHITLNDPRGNQIGFIQETSNFLAVVRRWLAAVSDLFALVFAFVPQKFDIYAAPANATPQLVGRIVHRKNPLIVKMGLDLSEGQASFDPRINLAICTLLNLRDIYKNA